MDDEPQVEQLENRIDELEATIQRMMPNRREVIGMAGAGLAGAGLMSGTASAGTNQVGTIGSQASPVDLESEDINNADTITTQDIVVNGTATGPFGSSLQGCRVFLSSLQNHSGSGFDKIEFDSKVYDQGNNFNTSTHNYVCPEDGLYIANLQLSWSGTSQGDHLLVTIGDANDDQPNGNGALYGDRDASESPNINITTVNQYSANDTIACYGFDVTNPAEFRGGIGANHTYLEVAFLGSF